MPWAAVAAFWLHRSPREAVMTTHLNSDTMIERRLRDARQAHSEHRRVTGAEGQAPRRPRLGARAWTAAAVAVLAGLALASFQSLTPSASEPAAAAGISTFDLTRAAGALPMGTSYDAH
jgi:hypothetical protein